MKTLMMLFCAVALCFAQQDLTFETGQLPATDIIKDGITYKAQAYGGGIFPGITDLQVSVAQDNIVALKITITLANGQTAYQVPVVQDHFAETYFVVDWSQVVKLRIDTLIVSTTFETSR